jgi:hypothetical protein
LPSGTTGTVENVQTDTYTTSYTRAYLPPSDPNRIYRVVGFYEYSKALQNLDELASLANYEEMAVIDEIVKSEPEFTIYTNLSRRLELGRSSLVEQVLVEKAPGGKDDGARKGFKWVTALARVEVGAALAGFSTHPLPFAAVAGKGYDKAEYKEMILDGAKMHFWSLTNDPGFLAIMRRFTPDSKTLTYLRRLNVASAFVYALAASSADEFNPAQKQEVGVYAAKLEKSRRDIRSQIEYFLSQEFASTKKTGSSTKSSLVQACFDGVCQQIGPAIAR